MNSSETKTSRFQIERSFVPLYFFTGGATLAIIVVYCTPPPWPLVATTIGAVLLVLFGVFLFRYRSGDRVAIGSAGPALLGPILAQFYVKFRAPHLESVLHNGGDLLIQLAFFFASLFGAAAYMFVLFAEDEEQHRAKKTSICFGILLVVLLYMSFFNLTDTSSPAGPLIAFGIVAPPLTHLTCARIGVALISIVVAAWPKPRAVRRRSQ